ncbi:hypothetical protein LIA77_05733 [Sarocladium implicatum]|nr:hypothetical protein LIA77_05733 [Sarocladium implicatum]
MSNAASILAWPLLLSHSLRDKNLLTGVKSAACWSPYLLLQPCFTDGAALDLPCPSTTTPCGQQSRDRQCTGPQRWRGPWSKDQTGGPVRSRMWPGHGLPDTFGLSDSGRRRLPSNHLAFKLYVCFTYYPTYYFTIFYLLFYLIFTHLVQVRNLSKSHVTHQQSGLSSR